MPKVSSYAEMSVPDVSDFLYVVNSSPLTSNKLSASRLLGLDSITPGGRLTLVAGTPVSVTDQIGVATLRYTPYLHDKIRLYDGTRVRLYSFTELSLVLTGLLASGFNYDVFVFDNAGVLTLELSSAWASASARTDSLSFQAGLGLVKTTSPTRLYLGTFRSTGTGTAEDSVTKRFLWNMYNRVGRRLFKADVTSHVYNGGYRQWNAGAANQVEFVTGLQEDNYIGILLGEQNAIVGIYAIVAQGLDSTTVPIVGSVLTLSPFGTGAGSNIDVGCSATIVILPAQGYHFVTAMEQTLSGGGNTFYDFTLQGQIVQ